MYIKYILTHPIQYQSPLIEFLTKKGIKIKVLYRTDMSTKTFFEKGFQKKIKHDIDLLKGYKYEFLNHIGPNKLSSILPLTTDFVSKIFDNKTDIIWLHGIKNWYNFIIIILAKFYNKKVFVRDESHLLIRGSHKKRKFVNNLFNYLLFKFLDRFISAYLAIGTINRKFYEKNKIDKKKIFKVPYVVDNNLFYKKKRNKKNKKITFLYAGKFTFSKGADILLRSINILNKNIKFRTNTKFIFVGDGEIKNESIEFAHKNNLENVRFFPFQKNKNLIKFYHKSDVFILPSRFETWGLTINEAMAGKNAIIASQECGASYDLIKNNKNGFTFKNHDVNDLSKKIYIIYKNKNKINYFKNNSLKIISKWGFKQCHDGLKKAMNFAPKK